jgi:hypothetical protein
LDTYLLTFFIVLVIGGIATWVRKRYLKKVMSQGLGRKVEDRDLTDISEWMEAIPDEPPPRSLPPRPHG